MGEVHATPEVPLRIVIADDHPVVRSGLRALLDSEPDLEVVGEGADAATAERLVRVHKPDVLVIDLVMPELVRFALQHGLIQEPR